MLLPTKTLSPDRSLVGLGAQLLMLLGEPKPVSRLWDDYKKSRARLRGVPTVTFGWFVLSLDLLFCLGLVRLEHNRLVRQDNAASQKPHQQ